MYFFYFCWEGLPASENGVLKPLITALVLICDYTYNSMCFMKLGPLAFGHLCFESQCLLDDSLLRSVGNGLLHHFSLLLVWSLFFSGIRTLTPAYFLGPFALTTFPVLPPRDSVCLLRRGAFLGGSKQMPPALCLTSCSVPFDRGVENISSQRSLKFSYCLLSSCWLCSAFFPRSLLFNYNPSIIFSSPWPQGLVFLFRLKDSFKCFL